MQQRQEVGYRQHDVALQADLGQCPVGGALKTPSIVRDDGMFQTTEPGQRGAPLQDRVPRTGGQHVAFMEKAAASQVRRRFGRDVESQIEVILLSALRQERGRELVDGQAHAGGLLSKPGQDGLQDRHQRIVGGDQSPRVVRRGGIEGLRRRDGLAQGLQRIVQRDAQLFGTCRGLHALRAGQQKRVIQQLAQAGQLHADGGLCQVQDLGGAGDMPFSQQGVERDEQIQVDAAQDAVKWAWSGVRGVHGSGGGRNLGSDPCVRTDSGLEKRGHSASPLLAVMGCLKNGTCRS